MTRSQYAMERPTFEVAAQLIVPTGPPPWLAPFLRWMAQDLYCDRLIEDNLLEKREMNDELAAIEDGMSQFLVRLERPQTRALLELDELGPMTSFPALKAALSDTRRRIEYLVKSSYLRGKLGKTRSGPGPARPPSMFHPKVLLAARFFEVWIYFHGREPGPRNDRARAAAQTIWIAAGGAFTSTGNPVNGWRKPFKAVSDNDTRIELIRLRAHWKREVHQIAPRGVAPFWIRTFFSTESIGV